MEEGEYSDAAKREKSLKRRRWRRNKAQRKRQQWEADLANAGPNPIPGAVCVPATGFPDLGRPPAVEVGPGLGCPLSVGAPSAAGDGVTWSGVVSGFGSRIGSRPGPGHVHCSGSEGAVQSAVSVELVPELVTGLGQANETSASTRPPSDLMAGLSVRCSDVVPGGGAGYGTGTVSAERGHGTGTVRVEDVAGLAVSGELVPAPVSGLGRAIEMSVFSGPPSDSMSGLSVRCSNVDRYGGVEPFAGIVSAEFGGTERVGGIGTVGSEVVVGRARSGESVPALVSGPGQATREALIVRGHVGPFCLPVALCGKETVDRRAVQVAVGELAVLLGIWKTSRRPFGQEAVEYLTCATTECGDTQRWHVDSPASADDREQLQFAYCVEGRYALRFCDGVREAGSSKRYVASSDPVVVPPGCEPSLS